MRKRPGRHIPQFDAMRVEHDRHRDRWLSTPYSHWTDCDACLAIAVVDRQRERLKLYESAEAPLWARAAFSALVLVAIAAVAIAGAGLVILPYLERARP